MAEMLTLEAFEEASQKVREVTLETKLVESPHFSAQTGNRVWLKPENMQRTGAYKVRGAYYKISTLSPEELSRGIITASAGNHAQGVAFAAPRAGARSVVVRPETTPLIKVERTKHYGAEVGVRPRPRACGARGLHLHPPVQRPVRLHRPGNDRHGGRAGAPARGHDPRPGGRGRPGLRRGDLCQALQPQDSRDRRGAGGCSLAHGGARGGEPREAAERQHHRRRHRGARGGRQGLPVPS